VSGLKSAHGLRRAGKNGPLEWHGGLLRTGETGPTRSGGRPAARVPRAGCGPQEARQWTGRGKVLGSSTTAKRGLHWAIGLKVGLIEEVRRRWGGGERPARRRSGGGRLRRGGGGLGGGPEARGGGEGGAAGAMSEQEEKHDVGGPAGGGRQHPFKGQQPVVVAGTQWRGVGGSRATRGGARGGGPWLSPAGDSSGDVAMANSEGNGVGRAQRKRKVCQDRMNSDDF
jgi:hypothetical protein